MSTLDQKSLLAGLRDPSVAGRSVPASDELLEAAADRDGRAVLIGLVNRPGVTNHARLAVLGALDGRLAPEEAATLARAVAKQHPSVVLRAISVLEASRSAAALFAVRKPLRRSEPELAEACDRAAERLASSLPEERYIRRGAVPPPNSPRRELAYAAAAAAPETLATVRERTAHDRLTDALGAGVRDLLEELATQSRSHSLTDFEGRLRDELHEVVLLTGVPADLEQQQRSLDNLFRRRDLADVSELIPHLPVEAVTRYATRALSRAHRRSERADRAVLALGMIEHADLEVSRSLHAVLVECLGEEDPTLGAGAIAALAARGDELSPAEQRQVIERFGRLPTSEQRALAPRLEGLAVGAEDELDVDSFLRWVEGAADEERPARLRALRLRWDTTVVDREHATSFLATLARGIDRLPPDDRGMARNDLLEGALSWLYRQGTQIVEPSRALLAWPGFAYLVLDDLDLSLSLLRAEQARGLLLEILRQSEDEAVVVSAIARADLDGRNFARVVAPVLGEAIRRDLWATDATFRGLEPVARRRLLHSALEVASHTKRRIESLGHASHDVADAETARHGDAVFAALHKAEVASEGNDSMQRHFDAVRRAVGSALAVERATEVPEAVAAWRLEVAERFPDAIDLPSDGREPLRVRSSAPSESVLRVLSELDRRVHSTRVVTAPERTHLRHDLLNCIDHVVRGDLIEGPTSATLSARSALGQLVWGRWADQTLDPAGELVRILTTPLDASSRQGALLKVDALAARMADETATQVVEALPADALGDAWSIVTAGLAGRLRQAESLHQEVKSRGTEIMERVAERLEPSLRAIEGLMVGYFRLRRQLSAAGWRPIEETLGKELTREALDPDAHEIDGSGEAERFIVRSLGVRVRGRPIRRAVVEPLEAWEDA